MGAFAVDKCGYDVAQGRQRQVDLGGFFQALPGGTRLALSLGPSQVNQVQFAHSSRDKKKCLDDLDSRLHLCAIPASFFRPIVPFENSLFIHDKYSLFPSKIFPVQECWYHLSISFSRKRLLTLRG